MLIPLGILAQGLPGLFGNFRFQTFGGAAFDGGRSIDVDGSGFNYFFGNTADTAGPGSDSWAIAKFDEDSTTQWQRIYGSTSQDFLFRGATDSAGNSYAVGRRNSSDPRAIILKVDSSGSLQWQRQYHTSTSEASAVSVDGSGNVYVAASAVVGSQFNWILLKYNSSGSLQFQRNYGSTSSSNIPNAIAHAASGDIYIAGVTQGIDESTITKWNSSGTLQWQRFIAGNGFSGMTLDSSGNVYCVARMSVGGVNSGVLFKFDSSGNLLFQRALGRSGFTSRFNQVALDSANNVYAMGITNSDSVGGNMRLIAKYDSSGTLIFQRVIGGAGFDDGEGLAIGEGNNPYTIGATNNTPGSNFEMFMTFTPNDGSLTGVYSLNTVNITYQASTLTASTPSFTVTTPTHPSGTPSLSDIAGSLTSATPSLTVHKVEL
jgi:hypothetical protein